MSPLNEERRPLRQGERRSRQSLGGGSTTPRYTRTKPDLLEPFDEFTVRRLAAMRLELTENAIDALAEVSRLNRKQGADADYERLGAVGALHYLANRLLIVSELERWPYTSNSYAHYVTDETSKCFLNGRGS